MTVAKIKSKLFSLSILYLKLKGKGDDQPKFWYWNVGGKGIYLARWKSL